MRARILEPSLENLQTVAEALQKNQVIGFPTETVYGLAGNCRSPEALTRIFETKERPTFDPLIVHVSSDYKGIQRLVEFRLVDSSRVSESMQRVADELMTAFWPGPLTLILPKHPDVPDLVTSGFSAVAIRMPQHPIAQKILTLSGIPLAAPSANRFGRISPTSPQAVAEELGDRIDWIVDGGPCQIGVESTVVAISEQGEITLLRPGGIDLDTLLKKVKTITLLKEQPSHTLQSPGLLTSHYAPQKPFYLLPRPLSSLQENGWKSILDQTQSLDPHAPIGFLLMSGNPTSLDASFLRKLNRPVIVRSLSHSGDLHEAARNLFAEMRALDSSEAQVLFSEPCLTEKGLGFAISDRLKRASAR